MLPQLPSYPPGPATIQAGAFHAMGSADTTTLHLQYWFIAVGFAVAVIGLLASRVHHAILFPTLLALLVAPSLVGMGHHGLCGSSDGLSHRRRSTPRHSLDRGGEDLAARRGDCAPLRRDADEA